MFYLKNLIEHNEKKSEEIKSNIYFVIINNWNKKFPKFFSPSSSRAICFIIIYWQFIMPLAFIFFLLGFSAVDPKWHFADSIF